MGWDPFFVFFSKLSPYFISLRFDTWYQAYWSMNSCLVVVNLCFEGFIPLIAIYCTNTFTTRKHTHTQEPFSESIQDQSYFKRRPMFNGGHSLTDEKIFPQIWRILKRRKRKNASGFYHLEASLLCQTQPWANPPLSRSWMVQPVGLGGLVHQKRYENA